MRQKRAKSYKKQMNVYLHSFKFREPFQTIVDDELILTCIKASFDLEKGLKRTVQGEVKPMITQCCIQALYDSKNQSGIDLAKKFERRRCNHPLSAPLSPGKCIESITNVNGENKHRYIIASQDISLRKKLRTIPGVPLIYMNRSVMVMEPLSDVSSKFSNSVESEKLTKGLNDVKYAGIAFNGEDELTSKPVTKKRKGPKAPNPLSVKKKKTEERDASSGATKKKTRRHRSKSNQEHIKEPISTEVSEKKS
ncbi:uncharacterized protein PRCAT00004193001 [Priceomyces carsonii]|uniref:uncharacterized protein n=1 Tax=Priceomyces carsonii TaxID=28549 RepID=UPI002EDA0148|nr:unnamed protein product [Priceomyces carsonii]